MIEVQKYNLLNHNCWWSGSNLLLVLILYLGNQRQRHETLNYHTCSEISLSSHAHIIHNSSAQIKKCLGVFGSHRDLDKTRVFVLIRHYGV